MQPTSHRWNRLALSLWIQEERCQVEGLLGLAKVLGIGPYTIQAWLTGGSAHISQDHIERIAEYRQMPVCEVLYWLNITPEHWQLMQAQHALEHHMDAQVRALPKATKTVVRP